MNIKKKESELQVPDLMVVMMNPGNSKPINGIDNYNKKTEVIPDQTQNQIMRIMINCGFEYARILNLSDARETSSSKFYQMIPFMGLKKKKLNLLIIIHYHQIPTNKRNGLKE